MHIVILLVVVYVAYHLFHVHRNYRHHNMGFWYSLRGPLGTRIRISKRF